MNKSHSAAALIGLPSQAENGKTVAPLASPRFAADYWITMRPYLLFISGITGLAGLAVPPQMAWYSTLALFAAFFLSYGFGQALTDCFQMDTDRLSSPYRPLVRGTIRRNDVLLISATGLAACAVIWTVFQPLNLIWSGIGAAGLATYTYFKKRWWAGPFYNAWIVVLLSFIGWNSAIGSAVAQVNSLIWTLATVFFGYANFVLAGYFKDVSADRATGYNTFPVVFGFKASALVSDVFAALTVIAAGLALCQSPFHAVGIPFALAGAVFTIRAQVLLHQVREESESHRAIADVLHGYMLLLSAIASARKPAWALGLILFYAAFVATLKARPAREQI